MLGEFPFSQSWLGDLTLLHGGVGDLGLRLGLEGCRKGRKVGREVTWLPGGGAEAESEVKTAHLLTCLFQQFTAHAPRTPPSSPRFPPLCLLPRCLG